MEMNFIYARYVKAIGLWGRVNETKYLERNNKLNITSKNPNWSEAGQLVMFKHGRGDERGTTGKQF